MARKLESQVEWNGRPVGQIYNFACLHLILMGKVAWGFINTHVAYRK